MLKQILVISAGLATASLPLFAHEEPFGYLRGAQSEAKGEWELTQWITGRIGKETGRYLGVDFATELEYGITDRLQVAVYLLTDYHFLKSATGSSETFDDLNRFGVNGSSLEIKYQLRDPFQESWGLSLYFEPGYKTIERAGGERHNEIEVEAKLILEKHFFEHRLITAFNYTIEPEFEHEKGSPWETSLKMGWNLGASWKFSRHWRLGIEGRLDTEFENADLDDSEYLSLFVGPTLHYSGSKYYATLTVFPQVRGWPDRNGTAGLHLDDRERLEVQLKFGFEF